MVRILGKWKLELFLLMRRRPYLMDSRRKETGTMAVKADIMLKRMVQSVMEPIRRRNELFSK